MADNYTISLDVAEEDAADELMALDDGPVVTTKKTRRGRGFGGVDTGSENRKAGDYESLPRDDVGTTKTAGTKSVEGWILLITGLHEETAEEDLLERFGEFGTVKGLHLNLDRRTGFVKGYALVEYETLDAAQAAITGANGTALLGLPLSVGFAFVRGPMSSKKTSS